MDEVKKLNFRVEFGGGIESLFDMCKQLDVTLSSTQANFTLVDLLRYMRTNLTSDQTQFDTFFDCKNETIRPGVLVLVNDVDWELLSGTTTTLSNGDSVTFISSLHGG